MESERLCKDRICDKSLIIGCTSREAAAGYKAAWDVGSKDQVGEVLLALAESGILRRLVTNPEVVHDIAKICYDYNLSDW